jgi:predicted metalloprotease with PDZ domain
MRCLAVPARNPGILNRMPPRVRAALAALVLLSSAGVASAQPATPIDYRISIPEPEHRWLQVEMTLADLPAGPLSLRMARSSPGRYAVHEFAKNVYDVQVADAAGKPLPVSRPNPHEWRIDAHPGAARVRYRVFGDRVDGTYLGVDDSHAHMNIPATLMYVNALATRPSRVTLVQPTGKAWKAATQLFPTADPLVFTAPNLQYLMDSPIEFGDIVIRSFSVAPTSASGKTQTIRVAMHHLGTDEELDAYVRDIDKVVREQQAIFGELPDFEPGHYTFLIDYLPWASGDGMEHRNSTVISSSRELAGASGQLIGTVAHEFFHCWNVERIRPKSLEPFNFDDANISGELWLAEGFTSYVDGLSLVRAGLNSADQTMSRWAGLVGALAVLPGRQVRSAVEMSQFAAFADGATAIDPTNSNIAFISYYMYGAAIGLGLDLSLRARTDGRIGLDDYMQALWERFGKTPAAQPGLVATPYTLADLRATLADVSGDLGFAESFFSRYVSGREMLDYAPLFARAGYLLRPAAPAEATMGMVSLNYGKDGARVTALVGPGSPAYKAGLEMDAVIHDIDGRAIASAEDVRAALGARAPGGTVKVRFTLRGREQTRDLVTVPNPRLELVSFESAGREVTPAIRTFRERWLD